MTKVIQRAINDFKDNVEYLGGLLYSYDEIKKSIELYKGQSSFLNSYLRNDKGIENRCEIRHSLQDDYENIDVAFYEIPLVKRNTDIHLFRGIDKNSKQYYTERTIKEKSYVSTSIDHNVARKFAGNNNGIMMHILVEKYKDTKMLPLFETKYYNDFLPMIKETIDEYIECAPNGEFEIILNRGTTFRVIKNKKIQDQLIKKYNIEVFEKSSEVYYHRKEDGKVYYHNPNPTSNKGKDDLEIDTEVLFATIV